MLNRTREHTTKYILLGKSREAPTERWGLENRDERGGVKIRDSSRINLDCHIFLKNEVFGTAKGQIEDSRKRKEREMAALAGGTENVP